MEMLCQRLYEGVRCEELKIISGIYIQSESV